MLTAKANPRAKIEGLIQGADAYLAKPFNKEELLIRIEKMIASRNKLQTHYQKRAKSIDKSGQGSEVDREDIFLQKLIQIVEENLSDEHFGLSDLGRKAGLSRSQLFRKLKALTGKGTTNFIRSIRLAKGKELLESTDLNISEVAYKVGYGSLAYFTRTFKEEFGCSPSAFGTK